MNSTGATGMAGGPISSAPAQQPSQTALEMAAGRKALERYREKVSGSVAAGNPRPSGATGTSTFLAGPTGPNGRLPPVPGPIAATSSTGRQANSSNHSTSPFAVSPNAVTRAARPVVPFRDHMERARIYRQMQQPNLLHYRDDFYDYEAGRYATIEDGTVKAALYRFLDSCQKVIQRNGKSVPVPFEPNTTSVSETINALEAVAHLRSTVEQPSWLDGRAGPDPSQLVSFPNGILDLGTNQFTPPDPALFTPHGVAFDYDPNAPTPAEWLNFLNQIFAGEQDQIDALQEMFGYCVSGDVSHEKAFGLFGPKRSGKDTVRHTLQSMISPKAVCGPTLDSMGTNFGMSAFIGKQLAIVGDMRLGSKCDKDLLAENILKLTGRGLFTIDRKHKEHWTGPLPCKLLLISNEMPKIKDTSGALASRLIVFLTRISFYGHEDPNLFRDKIKPELPGILNWSLEGLHRVRARGSLAETSSSMQAREDLAREGSPVLAFVHECLTLDPSASVSKDILYSAYVDYAEHNGLPITSKDWFFRDLNTATAGKIKDQRVRKGGNVHNVIGVRISTPPPPRWRQATTGTASDASQASVPPTQTAEDVGLPTDSDAVLDERIAALKAPASAS